ncbi:MAG: glycosyltransferase family 2 protein [Sulfuricaulis sp.]
MGFDRTTLSDNMSNTLTVAGNSRSPVVTVVIVNFNGGPLLTEAVRSVLTSSIAVDVLVGDNGSTDGSIELLRQSVGNDAPVRIIENRRNLGFSRANNLLFAQARGDYLLVLNPDALISSDTLERMVKVLQSNPDAGIAGCLIRNPDGSEQAGCRRLIPTPWRSLMRVLHLNRLFPRNPRFRDFVLTRDRLPTEPIPVEAISGSFMLVRREIIERVGVFDDAYFMHCEDLDWCMRVRQKGWQILFVPSVEVVHYRGTCSKARPIFVLWHKHKGMIRFYHKFFRHQYPRPLMLLVTAAVWTRFVVLAGLSLFWRKIIVAPTEWRDNKTQNHPAPKPAAPIKPLEANSIADATEIDPMLIATNSEAKHSYSRLR